MFSSQFIINPNSNNKIVYKNSHLNNLFFFLNFIKIFQKFDYIFWLFYKFIYLLTFFFLLYVVLKVFTYVFEVGVIPGFFEIFFSSLRFISNEFYKGVLNFFDKNINSNKFTFHDVERDAFKDLPEYQELLDSDYEDQARIFETVEYDFEDTFWIDESFFDPWSYRLINVPENYFNVVSNKSLLSNKKKYKK